MTFSAVLLAGGESRRMGMDKATMVFRGQPLWQRQIDLLRSLRPEKIFVSARTSPSWLPGDAALLLDKPPSRGPLSGLTIALTSMQTSHLVALAIDMPFMTGEQMRFLCGLAIEGRGLVPVVNDGIEPVAAIYPREVAVDFAAALRGSDFSLQTLIRKLAAAGGVQTLDVSDEAQHFYRSVNAPGDFAIEG